MNTLDGIFVLGGGVREGGQLPPWVIARFERALAIGGDAPIVCLSAGTVHRPPPLTAEGYPVLESVAGAAYLLSRGVAGRRIQVETASYDTIGNAYYARLLHADPAGWKRVAVITSEFHMPRTRAIFEWVFGMSPKTCRLEFYATANDGLAIPLLERRAAKEAEALELLGSVIPLIGDLRSLHAWLHTEHRAYTAEGWIHRKASALELVEIY